MYKYVVAILTGLPLFVFLFITSSLLLTEFDSSIDEYFVSMVLRSLLVVIAATALAQMITGLFLVFMYFGLSEKQSLAIAKQFNNLNTFPFLTLGIFSIALFLPPLSMREWMWWLAVLMFVPTTTFWLRYIISFLRKLYFFAVSHRVNGYRAISTLSPFVLEHGLSYFFLTLRRTLLPLVFVLVVSDYRIILPRLVEVGMTYKSMLLFFSLFVSVHLLSWKKARS